MINKNQFLSFQDVEDPHALVEVAIQLKYHSLKYKSLGVGKSICLIFFNSSLRTRLSTQKAGFNLGLNVSIFNVGEDGWQLETGEGVVMEGNKAEHIKEAARVIGLYHDFIGIRAFAELQDPVKDYQEEILKSFVTYSKKPVLNLESAATHPLQSLADIMTIKENSVSSNPKVVLTWAPHPRALPQAVANSFAEWTLGMNMDLHIAHPKGYDLPEKFTKGASIHYHQEEALINADFVYAKNWSSYSDYGKIVSKDNSWKLTKQKMENTRNGKFMHCLPVRRNVIADDDVIDSENSLILSQAENRTFAAQAVLFNWLRS